MLRLSFLLAALLLAGCASPAAAPTATKAPAVALATATVAATSTRPATSTVIVLTPTAVAPTATARPPATSTTAPTQAQPTAAIVPFTPAVPNMVSYRSLARFLAVGSEWQCILVANGTKTEDYLRLARDIHRRDPNGYYQVFDDDQYLQQFIDWQVYYGKIQLPYPEDWVNEHHLGNIQRMSSISTGKMEWVATGPVGEVLLRLD